jgi:hypothetical protein
MHAEKLGTVALGKISILRSRKHNFTRFNKQLWLRQDGGEIAKRQSLSFLNGDYAPYRTWAGIDPETGKVKTAQVNNFDDLFD